MINNEKELYNLYLRDGKGYVYSDRCRYDSSHEVKIYIFSNRGILKTPKLENDLVYASINDYIVEVFHKNNTYDIKVSRIRYIDLNEKHILIEVLHKFNSCIQIPRFRNKTIDDIVNLTVAI